MKFQAAAMGRADVSEEQREDFALYVDEFQNLQPIVLSRFCPRHGNISPQSHPC